MAMDTGHQGSENDQAKALFGPFELDLSSGELRRNGTKLRLQRQPFQILAILLERPGQAITREELCERIWHEGVHVNFDRSLAVAVKRLRDTLCDSTSKPRYIETVGRRAAVTGYRFVAPVQGTIRKQSAPLKLAVLPFSSLGFKADDYFLDGLVEELTARLGALIPSRLAVIARSSVIASVQGGKTPQDIGRQLKADYVLEGTVRSDRSKCRITVQLVRVNDQTTAWSHALARELEKRKNWLALESQVAKQIVNLLASRLFPGERVLHAEAGGPNPKAYEEYLRGRYHWWNAYPPEGIQLANRHYEKAIEIDPTFAAPYAGLADSCNLHAMYGTGPNSQISFRVAAQKVQEYTKRALELDPDLAEAHAAQGFCLMQFEWNWPAAEKEYQLALRLNQNSVVAQHWYAWGLVQTGRFEEGLARMEAARTLDPLSLVINGHLGWFLYLARRFDEAITLSEAAAQFFPYASIRLYALGLACTRTGRLDDAIKAMEECIVASRSHGAACSGMVQVYAAARLRDKALDALRSLEAMCATSLVSPYHLALAYASVGDRDRCFQSLETAVEEKSGWIPHVKVEPAFDELRSDPRWSRLLTLAAVNYGTDIVSQTASE